MDPWALKTHIFRPFDKLTNPYYYEINKRFPLMKRRSLQFSNEIICFDENLTFCLLKININTN